MDDWNDYLSTMLGDDTYTLGLNFDYSNEGRNSTKDGLEELGRDSTPAGDPPMFTYDSNYSNEGRNSTRTFAADDNQSEAEVNRLTRYQDDESGLGNITPGFETLDPTKPGYFEQLGTSISDWIMKNPNKPIEGLLTTLGATYTNDQRKQVEDARNRNALDLQDKKSQQEKDLLAEKDRLEQQKRDEQRRYNNASVSAMPDQRGIIQQALKRTDGSNVFNAQGQFNRG